jgi:hypothetical protein
MNECDSHQLGKFINIHDFWPIRAALGIGSRYVLPIGAGYSRTIGCGSTIRSSTRPVELFRESRTNLHASVENKSRNERPLLSLAYFKEFKTESFLREDRNQLPFINVEFPNCSR